MPPKHRVREGMFNGLLFTVSADRTFMMGRVTAPGEFTVAAGPYREDNSPSSGTGDVPAIKIATKLARGAGSLNAARKSLNLGAGVGMQAMLEKTLSLLTIDDGEPDSNQAEGKHDDSVAVTAEDREAMENWRQTAMSIPRVKDILKSNAMLKSLVLEAGPDAYIFGSQTSGTYKDESDIDIAVLNEAIYNKFLSKMVSPDRYITNSRDRFAFGKIGSIVVNIVYRKKPADAIPNAIKASKVYNLLKSSAYSRVIASAIALINRNGLAGSKEGGYSNYALMVTAIMTLSMEDECAIAQWQMSPLNNRLMPATSLALAMLRNIFMGYESGEKPGKSFEPFLSIPKTPVPVIKDPFDTGDVKLFKSVVVKGKSIDDRLVRTALSIVFPGVPLNPGSLVSDKRRQTVGGPYAVNRITGEVSALGTEGAEELEASREPTLEMEAAAVIWPDLLWVSLLPFAEQFSASSVYGGMVVCGQN